MDSQFNNHCYYFPIKNPPLTSFLDHSQDFESDLEGSFDSELFNTDNALGFLTSTQAELENSGLVSIDESIKHEKVYIEGIEVLFPYQPYEPQIAYMKSGFFHFSSKDLSRV